MRFSNNFNAYHFNLLLAGKTTDDILEGIANEYYTDTRVLALVAASADIIKSSNVDWGIGADQINLDEVPDGTIYQRIATAYLDASGRPTHYYTGAVKDFITLQTSLEANTTHRGSAGIDHSDVGLANSHRATVSGNPHVVIDTDIPQIATNTTAIANKTHNSLASIQGGTAGEYQHLTTSEHTELTQWIDNVVLGSDGKITFMDGSYIDATGLVMAAEKQIDAKYIVIDSDDDYGANPEVENFVSGLTGWTIADGVGCVSSYLASKTLDKTIKHVLQQYDNSAIGICALYKTFNGSLIFSEWTGTSDVLKYTYLDLFEGTTRIGVIAIHGGNFTWYDGAWQTLQSVVANIYYHITLVFSATDDDVDIYIDGEFNSTQTLENNITTSINKIKYTTGTADVGSYGYHASLYYGDSLSDAFTSLYDGTIQCKGIILSTTTRYLTFNGTDMRTTNPDIDNVTISWQYARSDAGSPLFYTSVHLPNGATITGAIMYGSGGVAWNLYRADHAGNITAMASSTMGIEDTTITTPIIDNVNYSYAFRTNAMAAVRFVYGARITYTIKTPLP